MERAMVGGAFGSPPSLNRTRRMSNSFIRKTFSPSPQLEIPKVNE
jgi:hypothetical protein